MADYVITSSNVKPGAGAVVQTDTCGEAINAGQAVYKSTSDQKMYLADADDSSKQADGIAVATTDAVDQPIAWVGNSGALITTGATTGTVLAAGQTIVLSTTAGALAPEADLASAKFYSLIAIGYSTTQIRLNIDKTGIAHA